MYTVRRGFTLLEMLIVLAILAALTMTAVQSLEPLERQARSQTTLRTLETIRDGIVQQNETAIGGFAADTGRLPQSVAELTGFFDNTGTLTTATDLPAFHTLNITSVSGDGTNWSIALGAGGGSLPRGWQGPYVSAAAGANDVVDGWGYSLTQDPLGLGTLVVSTTGIWLRAPAGLATAVVTTSTGFVSTFLPSSAYTAVQISGNVYSASSTVPSHVLLLAPGLANEHGSGVAVHCVAAQSTGTGGSSAQPVATYSLNGSSLLVADARAMLVGPRLLTAATNSSGTITSTGAMLPIVVRPGAQTFDLFIP